MLLSALACLGAAGALAAHLCRRRAAAARREFAVAKGIRRAAEQVRCVAKAVAAAAIAVVVAKGIRRAAEQVGCQRSSCNTAITVVLWLFLAGGGCALTP